MLKTVIAYSISGLAFLWVAASLLAKIAGVSTVIDDSRNAISLLARGLDWLFSQPTWVFLLVAAIALTINAIYLFRPKALQERIDWVERPWIGPEEAAHILFGGLRDLQEVRDLVSEERRRPHPRPVEAAMAWWLQVAIEEGKMRTKGSFEGSNQMEELPPDIVITDSVLFEMPDGSFSDELSARLMSDSSQKWRNLRFKRSDVVKYLRELQADHIKRKGVKALQKKGG